MCVVCGGVFIFNRDINGTVNNTHKNTKQFVTCLRNKKVHSLIIIINIKSEWLGDERGFGLVSL